VLAGAGVEARIGIEVQYAALLASFVARGLGLGLVEPFTAASLPAQEVVRVPFAPALPFYLGLLHPSQRPLSRAAWELLTLIRQHRTTALGHGRPRSVAAPNRRQRGRIETADVSPSGAA
jgi:DNA-binding transcriptional LysR family regulator